MMDFRVIIAGSRYFEGYEFLKDRCDRKLVEKLKTHNVIIVTNHDRGVAILGERYARERGLQIQVFLKNPEDGNKAINIRNEKMVKASDAMIFFTDETVNMSLFDMACKFGLKVTNIPLPREYVARPERENTSYDPVAAILAQRSLCEKKGQPLWVTTSRCGNCRRELFVPGGISIDKAGKEVITSCPFCHHSFVD